MAVALRTNDMYHVFSKFINARMTLLGVFPADKLPNLEYIRRRLNRDTSKCCFVANTDPSNLPGKHWVLFLGELKNGRLKLGFFDSYGMPLMLYLELHGYCTALNYLPILTIYNSKQLQSLDSVLCGHYCFLFAFLSAHSLRSCRSVLSYIEKLGVNVVRRDAALFRLVKRIWGSFRPQSLRPLSAHRNANRCDQCCCSFH